MGCACMCACVCIQPASPPSKTIYIISPPPAEKKRTQCHPRSSVGVDVENSACVTTRACAVRCRPIGTAGRIAATDRVPCRRHRRPGPRSRGRSHNPRSRPGMPVKFNYRIIILYTLGTGPRAHVAHTTG